MHLTSKQIQLMKVICLANPDGTPTDLDQILERLGYETTKASLQFSIRALIGHGLIEKKGTEKRRGRQRVLIGATELGAAMLAPRKNHPAYVVNEDSDDVIEEIFED